MIGYMVFKYFRDENKNRAYLRYDDGTTHFGKFEIGKTYECKDSNYFYVTDYCPRLSYDISLYSDRMNDEVVVRVKYDAIEKKFNKGFLVNTIILEKEVLNCDSKESYCCFGRHSLEDLKSREDFYNVLI